MFAAINVSAAAVSVLRRPFSISADVQTAVTVMNDAAVTGAEREPLDAQTPVFIGSSDGAHLRYVSEGPAAACVAAALHLGVLTRQFTRTAAVRQRREARPDPMINTSGAVCAGDVSSWTGAHVAAGGVCTLSPVTHSRYGCTFIDVFTLLVGLTLSVTRGAFALIRAHSVDAVSSSTQSRDGLAFVHVLACTGADVGNESSPAGVWLGRAHLTRVTPRSANGGAAERFGAHDATQLTLAHLIVDLSEARSSPVVSLALRPGETVNAGTSVGSDAAAAVLTSALAHRLSAVSSCVSLLTGAGVFITHPTIHTSDAAGLDSSRTTARGKMTTRTGTHVGPRAKAITTGVPTDWNYTLVPSRKRFPSWTTIGVEAGTAYVGPPEGLLAPPPDPLLHLPLRFSSESAGLDVSISLPLHRMDCGPP